MPKPRAARLETPTARDKLAVRKAPYYKTVSPNIQLGYRRNEGAGTWSVRVTGKGGWLKRIGLADDKESADGRDVLTYWQAIDAARKLARRRPGDAVDDSRPLLVADAIDQYESELLAKGADPYNATQARLHSAALLSRPVALLDARELIRWRGALVAKGLAPSSINRVRNCLRAALTLAAKRDRRIRNAHEWQKGFDALADAQEANNVVLDDDTVRAFVAAAYAHSWALGSLIDVLATTGTRPSQAARLTIADLKADDPLAPRLRMPKSGKGGTKDRLRRKAERFSVPITVELAALLKEASAGRALDAPLLMQDSGEPWGDNPSNQYRRDVRVIVAAVGLEPDEVTAYSLRHSSIVRALLRNVPIRVVASLHDTSVQMIEKHYSAYIPEHSDEVARKALLQPESPADDVIQIRQG
jgi:integrase